MEEAKHIVVPTPNELRNILKIKHIELVRLMLRRIVDAMEDGNDSCVVYPRPERYRDAVIEHMDVRGWNCRFIRDMVEWDERKTDSGHV